MARFFQGWASGGGAAVGLPAQQQGQCHIQQHPRPQELKPPQAAGHLLDVPAVEVGQKIGTQVPAVMPAQQEREGEHALELAQGVPDVQTRRFFDRREVDKRRPAPHELNVVGAGVLEGTTGLQQPGLQVQRVNGCVGQHREGPLIRPGQRGDHFVFQEMLVPLVLLLQFQALAGVVHEPGLHEHALGHQFAEQPLLVQPAQKGVAGAINRANKRPPRWKT